MITCEPTPAIEGLNVPVAALVIPVPLHVPPACAATKLTAAALIQNGPAGVIAVFAVSTTCMLVVCKSPQTPLREYVIVCVPIPAVEGLKVPVAAFVIPVPLHVPPNSTGTKFKAGSVIQNGPAGLIVASASAIT